MSRISELAESIIKNDKMTAVQVIEYIETAMEEGKDTAEAYRCLYEKAYGNAITRELADTWVKSMSVTDGSDRMNGMKWTYDQTTDVGNKMNLNWTEVSKVEWYVLMNMMYSDFYHTARVYDKQTDVNFFANLSKDWIFDEDACEDKLYRYYFQIVTCKD